MCSGTSISNNGRNLKVKQRGYKEGKEQNIMFVECSNLLSTYKLLEAYRHAL